MSVRYASVQPARSPAAKRSMTDAQRRRREVGVGAEVALAAERQARERVHRPADVHVDPAVDRFEHAQQVRHVGAGAVHADDVVVVADDLADEIRGQEVPDALVRREHGGDIDPVEHVAQVTLELHRGSAGSRGPGRASRSASRRAPPRRPAGPARSSRPPSGARHPWRGPAPARAAPPSPIAKIRSTSSVVQRVALAASAAAEVHADARIGHPPEVSAQPRARRASSRSVKGVRLMTYVLGDAGGHGRSLRRPSLRYAGGP